MQESHLLSHQKPPANPFLPRVFRSPQASPAWRCLCTSLRPPHPTSGASWWRWTPSSSPVASSLPALWTAPSVTCSTTDGGQKMQPHTATNVYARGFIPKAWLIGRISLIFFFQVLIISNARKSHTGFDTWWKCQRQHRSPANICPHSLLCMSSCCHSECSTWMLRSIRSAILLPIEGLAFPRVVTVMSVMFGKMVRFICDNNFRETFIECLTDVSACTAEGKPSICTFSWNYTEFFQGPLCPFTVFLLSAFQPQKYCGLKVYYLVQESFLHSLLIQRQFFTHHTTLSAVSLGWSFKKLLAFLFADISP